MATAYCDIKPCAKLKELFEVFQTTKVIVENTSGRELLALTNEKVPEVVGVTLYYCPFCGTRLVGSVFLGEDDE